MEESSTTKVPWPLETQVRVHTLLAVMNINSPLTQVGGLVFGNSFGNKLQYHEWTEFLSDNAFCIRACHGAQSKSLCNHIYDIMGCWWVSNRSPHKPFTHGEKELTPLFRTCPQTTSLVNSKAATLTLRTSHTSILPLFCLCYPQSAYGCLRY